MLSTIKKPTLITFAKRCVHVEARIAQMGLDLPAPPTPKGTYRNFVRVGNMAFLAGHLPQPAGGGPMVTGKVGPGPGQMTTEEGNKAAEYCALNILSTLKSNVSNLDNVRIVKLVGFVNCADEFTAQPSVINGCSDLLGKVFEEKGIHARSAVGTNALPLGVAVEIEAIVEIDE